MFHRALEKVTAQSLGVQKPEPSRLLYGMLDREYVDPIRWTSLPRPCPFLRLLSLLVYGPVPVIEIVSALNHAMHVFANALPLLFHLGKVFLRNVGIPFRVFIADFLYRKAY